MNRNTTCLALVGKCGSRAASRLFARGPVSAGAARAWDRKNPSRESRSMSASAGNRAPVFQRNSRRLWGPAPGRRVRKAFVVAHLLMGAQ